MWHNVPGERERMTVQASDQARAWSFELKHWLMELRARTILFALLGLYLLGAVLLAMMEPLRQPFRHILVPLAMFCLVPILLFLRKRSPLVAAWTLTVGCLIVNLAVVAWWGLEPAICMLASSVGLAFLTIGTTAGVTMAAGCTLVLLLVPATLLPVLPALRAVALIGVWSTAGMIWLVLNPLLATVRWAWSSYQQSQISLERARDYQVQLHETLKDLTSANVQLVRLNQLANSLRQVAEDERRAKEQFAANVSHELRTPLNMIIGFCEMITESPGTYGGELSPTLLADLTVILRNSQHLSDLIDDVLDLGQIEAGQMALTKERTSLAEIVQAATIAVRPLFESKGLYLETEMPEELPLIFCDRTRIHEVVLNLLSNAGRFTEQGGVRVRAWQEANDVVVSVADTGMGIAEKDRGKLFQPFQQLDGTIRRRYGGTGLGLSISKSFVELHDGKMWIESREGNGTTFYVRLPIDPPLPLDGDVLRWFNPYQPYEERPRRSRIVPAAIPPRMVVVEKGNAMQRLLTRYLDGVEIVSTASLEESVAQVSQTPARALVINETSVGDALRHLDRSVTLPPGIPAILCSVPGLEQATGALGVSDYLLKPVSREALLAALDRLETRVETVLVVDDEQDVLQLFWRMLSSTERGYRVLRAYDGRQALEILRRERPDVVLLDLLMPEMNGFEFLAVKSEDPTLCDIPVVLISARDPLGQPIVSNALAVTSANGLSVPDLLACVEALSAILSTADSRSDPTPKAGSGG
jgi:signal transduction histidine kinase/DNA-binding response OmpR family regulator